MIKLIENGDIFDGKADAFCHGVNTKGVMGGLAGEIAKRFPDLAHLYEAMCELRQLDGGDILPVFFDKWWIYNLVTQIEPGADARLDLIEETVAKMIEHAEVNGVKSINIPKIGSGIGGLKWDDVLSVITKAGEESSVVLRVCI
jgi:O-acetyl-ADP-ribose deacetylase (regulator of RNase III)